MATRGITAIMAIVLGASCGTQEPTPNEPQPSGPTLRVLTYNVNYGLAGDVETLAAIEDAEADIVVLQETTPAWESAIRDFAPLSVRYPHMHFHHSRGAGGMAVLARFPLHEQEIIEAPSEWFPAWRLVVDSAVGRVQLLVVHLHPPVSDSGSVVSGYFTTPTVREREIVEYLEHLDPTLPTIVAGDFNERDGRAIEALRARGFRSAVTELHGRRTTWRWQTSLGEIRAQLDHVAHDERLVPRSAEVIEAGRSDHLPVIVVFEGADES